MKVNEATKLEPEITIEDLSVVFPPKNGGNEIKALKNINLEIGQGEFISLVGPSGCGKTTLLRTIADLQQPTTGDISIRGRSPKEIRLEKKLGIVFSVTGFVRLAYGEKKRLHANGD